MKRTLGRVRVNYSSVDLRAAAVQPFEAARAEKLRHQRDRDRPERSGVGRERELRVKPLFFRKPLSFRRVDEVLWGRLEEELKLAAARGLVVLVQQQQGDLGGERKPNLRGDN